MKKSIILKTFIMLILLLILGSHLISAEIVQLKDLYLETPVNNYITNYLPEDVPFTIIAYPNSTLATTNCYLNLSNSTDSYPHVFQPTSCSYDSECVLPGLDVEPNLTGIYTWTAYCQSNESGVIINTSLGKSHTIIFDREGPEVSLNNVVSVFKEGEIEFNFTATDNFDSENMTCSLYVDSQQLQTNIQAPNGTQVTVIQGVSGGGNHTWQVKCKDSAQPTGNEGDSAIAIFEIDKTPPAIQLLSPKTNIFVAGNKSQDFIFNVTDDFSSQDTCNLVLSNEIKNTTIALNNTLTSLSFKNESGTFDWFVNCSDEYGNVGQSETRTITFDNSGPEINLSNAFEDGFEKTENTTTNFNFKIEDNYSTSGFTCELYLNGTEVKNKTGILNNTNDSITYTFTKDGTYEWNLKCKDSYGNSKVSNSRTIIAKFAPSQPVLWKLKNAVSDLWLTIEGYINKYGLIKTTSQNLQTGDSNYNETPTYDYPQETNYLGSTTVGSVYTGSNNTFSITDTDYMASGNLTNNSYIEFPNHKRTDYRYYAVTNVTDYGSYYKITIKPDFETNISSGDIIDVYDRDRPTGWFNTSIELHPGYNNLTVQGLHGNISGATISKMIYLDIENPVIYLTNYSNVTQPNKTFEITASDDFNLSSKTILVEFQSNSNQTNYYFLADETVYNASTLNRTLTPNLICQENLTEIHCNLTLNLSTDDYNLTLKINDSFNHTDIKKYDHIIIRTQVLPVSSIQNVWGSTTQNATFLVNWTPSTDPYLAKYQLSVGSLPGKSDVVSWFDVNKSLTAYTVQNDSIEYGKIYYVNIRPVDEAGNIGSVSSTELIYTNDPSPPIKKLVEIVPAQRFGNWITDPYDLNLSWSFEDNETGVRSYEYAVGTKSFDDPDHSEWNNIIPETYSNNSLGEYITGLHLQEGQTYYLSVRAKNGNEFTPWSSWYSSPAVTLDSKPPVNISIQYEAGNQISNSVLITYFVGNDSGEGEINVSGLDKAEILYKDADFRHGQCDLFSDWKLLKSNLSLSNPGTYTDNELENGKCYHFALKVFDKAGNYNLTTYSELVNLSVDMTPPSAVNISGDPSVIAENTLSFSWTPSEDDESGIKNYKCSLGTSQGSSDVTNGWLDCGTSTYVTLYNLSLTNSQIYYFNVQPVNNQGLTGPISTSYGLLYFDIYPPKPLKAEQVGSDTNSSDGWVDTSLENYTLIKLEGEKNLQCEWSYYDIDYINPTVSYANACTQTTLGNYECNITNLTESERTIHISCKDLSGNVQTAEKNTDLTFKKEMSGPVINITYPQRVDEVISEMNPIFQVNISDVSEIQNATYSLIQGDTGQVLETKNLTGDYEAELNLTNYSGELLFKITATDIYNRSTTTSKAFLINHDSPQINVLYQQDGNPINLISTIYLNNNKTLSLKEFFVNKTSYKIVNSSGSLITGYNSTWENQTGISIIHEQNISLNSTDFTTDGNYTLELFAEGNNTQPEFKANKTIIFDRTNPTYLESTIEHEPTSIYENQTDLTYYIVVDDKNLDTVLFNYSIDGNSYEVTAQNAEPRLFHPNDQRFKVTIPAYEIISNATIKSKWIIRDKAGNENETGMESLTVNDRKPVLNSTNLTKGLATVEYIDTIPFEDLDNSQKDFDCIMNLSKPGLTINHTNNTHLCVIKWVNPVAGNYSINVTVFDKKDGIRLQNDTKQYLLSIYPNGEYNISLNTDSNLFNVELQSSTDYQVPVKTLTDGTSTITIPKEDKINLSVSNYNFKLTATNVPSNASSNFYFREASSPIQNSTFGIGTASDDEYLPIIAYAINLSINKSNNATINYTLEFNYSKLGINGSNVARLKILKFPFDEKTETIIFNDSASGDGLLNSTIDTSRKIIYTTIHNFSIVILALDREIPTCSDGVQNQGETGVDCGGPCNACPTYSGSSSSHSSTSGSSSSSGGGLFIPQETCFDGIKNQNETGVDCGGPCKPCIVLATCSDGVQNQGETGVDCGGPCKPCTTKTSTCFDGIKNQNEEGVDCGGVCPPCSKETTSKATDNTESQTSSNGNSQKTTEVPRKEYPLSNNLKNPYLLVMMGFLVIGGLIIIVIEAPRKGLLTGNVYKKLTHFETKDNIVTIARYIRKQKTQGISGELIEKHLLKNGFSQINIDLAIHILEQERELQETINYFEKYSLEGYSLPEMVNWLFKKGVDEHLLAIAIDLYREKHKPN